MEIQKHINSLFNSISYRIGSAIIDPGDNWDGFIKVKSVLLTHAHFDHIYGLNELFLLNPEIKVYTNEKGKEMLQNARKNLSLYHETKFVFEYPEQIVVVEDGDEIEIEGDLIVKAILTPGHNPSCITWLIGDALFTGDSYIPGMKTVTNLPNGNKIQAEESIKLITELAWGRTIYPGHMIKKKESKSR